MKPSPVNCNELVTHLLLLPDGSVLAENLTPSMAAALQQINVHADPRTQSSLRGCAWGKTVVSQPRAGDTPGTP